MTEDEPLKRLQLLAGRVSLEKGEWLVVNRRENDDGKGEFVVHDHRLEESFYYDLDEVTVHLKEYYKGDEHETD